MRLLLACGADPDALDAGGRSALAVANAAAAQARALGLEAAEGVPALLREASVARAKAAHRAWLAGGSGGLDEDEPPSDEL